MLRAESAFFLFAILMTFLFGALITPLEIVLNNDEPQLRTLYSSPRFVYGEWQLDANTTGEVRLREYAGYTIDIIKATWGGDNSAWVALGAQTETGYESFVDQYRSRDKALEYFSEPHRVQLYAPQAVASEDGVSWAGCDAKRMPVFCHIGRRHDEVDFLNASHLFTSGQEFPDILLTWRIRF